MERLRWVGRVHVLRPSLIALQQLSLMSAQPNKIRRLSVDRLVPATAAAGTHELGVLDRPVLVVRVDLGDLALYPHCCCHRASWAQVRLGSE